MRIVVLCIFALTMIAVATGTAHGERRAFTVLGSESQFRDLPRSGSRLATDVSRAVGDVALWGNRIAVLTVDGRISLVDRKGRIKNLPTRLPGYGEFMQLDAEPGGTLLAVWAGRVFRIASDGTATLVAGARRGGNRPGDGGPAKAARLYARAVDSLPGGGYLLAEGVRIRRVLPDGTIQTIAGSGRRGTPVLGPALQSPLGLPKGVAATPGGGFFFAHGGSETVWRVDPTGTMQRAAGGGRRADIPRAGAPADSVWLSGLTDVVPMSGNRLAVLGWNGLHEVGAGRIREVIHGDFETVEPFLPLWSGERVGRAWVGGPQGVAGTPGGEWLVGSGTGVVLVTRPDGKARRFAAALHPGTQSAVWRGRLRIAATQTARVRIRAVIAGRTVTAARGRVRPGLTTLRLARRLSPGPVRLELRATTPDGATVSHRLLVLGSRLLPVAVARRAIDADANAEGNVVAETRRCRRLSSTLVTCRVTSYCECGTWRYRTFMQLRRDGWIWGRYGRRGWFRLETL